MSSSGFQLNPETPVVRVPRDGTPRVLTSDDDIRQAGLALANGTGPLAVDTERASAFRYGDRAFLLQFRRAGAGTFLIDPEANPEATRALGSLLNPLTWTLHAAPSDLPCLVELQLYPSFLFDTEVAGRLLGLEKVNLAALTELFLGVGLAKGHGREDWSTRPIPTDWINYAALDVELLNELCTALHNALAELGREEWFNQECEYIRTAFSPQKLSDTHKVEQWRELKGFGKLTRPSQLVVAKALWHERDRIAKSRDCSPPHVLSHAALLGIAEALPRNAREITAIKGFPRRRRGAANQWLAVTTMALNTPQRSWPQPAKKSAHRARPHHRHWPECAPDAAALATQFAEVIQDYSQETGIRTDTIATAAELRNAAWWAAMDFPSSKLSDVSVADTRPSYLELRRHFIDSHKRPWQAALLAELFSQRIFLYQREKL